MRYSKYTIFLKVVELESFSKTADFYKYSQSGSHTDCEVSGSGTSDDIIKTKSRRSVSDFRRRTAHPYIWELAMAEERMWEKAGEITGMDRGLIRIIFSSIACHYLPGGDERIPKIISGN